MDRIQEEVFKELDFKQELVKSIIKKATEREVTLLFSSKEEKFNNAVALKEYIETRAKEVK